MYRISVTWHQRRAEYFHSPAANTHCPGCGRPVGGRDDVHHLEYPPIPGTERDYDLVVLDRECHEFIHTSLDASPGWRKMGLRAASWGIIQLLREQHTLTPQAEIP